MSDLPDAIETEVKCRMRDATEKTLAKIQEVSRD